MPDSVIPRGQLPPLRYRDLPEPVSWRKMIGPSIILAGLALGSGEFIFWPYITSGNDVQEAFPLFKFSAAMNGGVMFLYSAILLYFNRWKLPPAVRASGWRVFTLIWAVLFFGVFAGWAGYDTIKNMVGDG